MELLIVLLPVCAVLGAVIGNQRTGKAKNGFFLGLFLGPLGLLMVALEKPDDEHQGLRACPHCAEKIKAEAKVCRYCSRDVAAAV